MSLSKSQVLGLRDALIREDEWAYDALGAKIVPRQVINSWRLVPTKDIKDQASLKAAFRINSFANLYYFAVNTLHKSKFQKNPNLRLNLHYQMCMAVMKDGLKEVIEIPRDHFKSTVYSESFPIWRALPFTNEDEDLMYALGATPIYLHWMRKAHNQNIRIILVSEVTKNAEKLGKRTRTHYESNGLFKHLFPEILPKTKNTWTNTSLHQTRTDDHSGDGEGTFDFIGVGGALQSTHYDLAIQDDLVGRDALKSESVMKDTIEYHQLLAGAINADNEDSRRDFDEIVVGNRWSHKDLNSYIRDKEQYFNFITHSALGGCCSLHPLGTPIFPESFSIEKLSRYKKRFGTYFFSCQWLNYPVNPEKCKFDLGNLRYFHLEADTQATFVATEKRPARAKIRHHVAEGDVEEDIFPRNLQRNMIVDPNHSGSKGRCRHAFIVTGVRQDRRRVYCFKGWAKACSISEFVETVFRTALAYKVYEIHLETIAAQKFLKFHLEYFIIVNRGKEEWKNIETITIKDLKSGNSENAKTDRIDSFVPVTERKELWLNVNDCDLVKEEMETYGNHGALIDLLDCFGYGPQVWKFDDVDEEEIDLNFHMQQMRFTRAMAMS